MSAWGVINGPGAIKIRLPFHPQNRTSPSRPMMSVSCQYRKWQKLFNYFVGGRKQCWWHIEAERFRSLKIDDELELGRLFNWQIGRLLALEDFIDIHCGKFVQFEVVGPVSHKTSGFHKGPVTGH